MRLIDADALIKKVINGSPAIGMVSVLMESWFYAAIKSMPTIGVEPRLLTLHEALGADECWIEGRNGACGYGDALLTDDAERVEFFRPHTISTLDFYAYGKDWRCWSTKPTDEQREATAWN